MLTDSWFRFRWGGAKYQGWPGVAPGEWVGELDPPLRLVAPGSPEQARDYFVELENRSRTTAQLGWLAYELGPLADPAMGAHKVPPGTVLAQFSTVRNLMWVSRESRSGLGARSRLQHWRGVSCGRIHEFGTMSRDEYLESVRRLLNGIRAGDYYEANLSMRFRIPSRLSGELVATELFDALDPAFGAVVQQGGEWLVSASPELFLRRQGRTLVTRPIKGSALRHEDGDLDRVEASRLVGCPKNAAEHLMVVDLARNDLGRICEPGTVSVVDFCRVETHPAVHHLVSTITGQIDQRVDLWSILQGTWPPASITGCPKIAVTQALAREETTVRGVYTGSVGLILPGGDFQFNVAIRTVTGGLPGVDGVRVWTMGSGGAVVADSCAEAEWEECLMKASPLAGCLLQGWESIPVGEEPHKYGIEHGPRVAVGE